MDLFLLTLALAVFISTASASLFRKDFIGSAFSFVMGTMIFYQLLVDGISISYWSGPVQVTLQFAQVATFMLLIMMLSAKMLLNALSLRPLKGENSA